jgi:hypothetical protein
MVEKVEAAIDPEAAFFDCYIGLRVDGPVSGIRNDAADFWVTPGRHLEVLMRGWV